MSIAPSEFWSRLVQVGLANPEGCQRHADEFSKACNDSDVDSVHALASFLVAAGVVTKYQSVQLTSDTPVRLRVGPYVMSSDKPVQPFSHWIPVQTPVSEQSPISRHGFMLRIPLAGLDDNLRSWIAIHSEIQSESLQSFELSGGAQSGDAEQMVEIFSPISEGGSLLKVLQSKPSLSGRKTVRIGADIAAALHSLHTASTALAHGAIGADHVWVTPKGNALLLRDPSSPARSPRGDLSTSWIDRIESPAQYAAPELADPSMMPTPASDIYSLGCLLFSLYVGNPAFQGDDDRDLFAAHNEVLPQELRSAVDAGAQGNPILRVLAYAMAKDPANRFDSAATFADALRRAGEVETNSPLPQPNNNANTSKTSSEPDEKLSSRPQPPTKSVDPTSARTAPETKTKSKATPKSSTTAAARQLADSNTEAPKLAPANPAIAIRAEESPQVDSIGSTAESSPEMELQSDSESEQLSRRRRRRRKKNRIPILAGMMVLPLLMLGLAIALRGRGPEKTKPRPRPTPGVVRNVPVVPDSRREVTPQGPQLVNGFEIVDSDRLLWVPPYSANSESPSLELLPPGPAVIVSVRLAHLLEKQTTDPLISTFENEMDAIIKLVEKRSGTSRSQIERCTAAVFPGRDGWPDVSLSISLTEPAELKTLTENWGAFESRTADGSILYAGEEPDSDAFFIGDGEKGKLPPETKVKRFAVGKLKRIQEVAESNGGSIPLVRGMQTLWGQASVENDVVVLANPNFLFADGRQMLASSVPEFRNPLKQWLIPDVGAVSLSLNVSDSAFYAELREIPSGGATSVTLVRSLRESIESWSTWADSFILNSVPDPSWRLLATRLPMMLRYTGEQTRSTIVGETVVASVYLPADAAAQVSLGTFLAMNTAPSDIASIAAPAAKSLTVEEQLNRPMSISFLALSLEFAIDAVAEEFEQSLPDGSDMPNIRIIGGDLEMDGITQNQSIRGFERDEQPLRKVLTDIVLMANPDKTTTGPDDPKQALIWVVHPTGKPAAESEILITTRKAAKDKYVLPKEFEISTAATAAE